MTKLTRWLCTQFRHRSTWASTQSDQSSLCDECVAKDPSLLHVDSEDSDQTGWMPRLIWVFAGCTCHFVDFVMRRLIWVGLQGYRKSIFCRFRPIFRFSLHKTHFFFWSEKNRLCGSYTGPITCISQVPNRFLSIIIPIIKVVNTLELLNREKWDLVSSRYLSRDLAPKKPLRSSVLELIKYSWGHDTIAQTTCTHD